MTDYRYKLKNIVGADWDALLLEKLCETFGDTPIKERITADREICTFKECGFKIALFRKRVVAIDLYGPSDSDVVSHAGLVGSYEHTLPEEVKFGMSLVQLELLLSKAVSQGTDNSVIPGKTIDWKLFLVDNISMKCYFDPTGSLCMVSLQLFDEIQSTKVLIDSEHYIDAIPVLEGRLSKHPTTVGLLDLARCYKAVGNVEKADLNYRKAIDHSSRTGEFSPFLTEEFAYFLEEVGKLDESYEYLEKTHDEFKKRKRSEQGMIQAKLEILGRKIGRL
jgi:hypothetical protein